MALTPGFDMVATDGYHGGIRAVGIKTLRDRLSEYVRLAAGGETVLVTDRDRVVAVQRPPEGRGPTVSDAWLAEAVREGWMRPPLTSATDAPPRRPVAALADALRGLSADREDRNRPRTTSACSPPRAG